MARGRDKMTSGKCANTQGCHGHNGLAHSNSTGVGYHGNSCSWYSVVWINEYGKLSGTGARTILSNDIDIAWRLWKSLAIMCMHGFYPRDAMLARVIAIVTCLSITSRYCIKTKKASPSLDLFFSTFLLLSGDIELNPGPSNFTVCTLNTRSILHPLHSAALSDLVDLHKPDLVCLSET